MLVTNLTSNLYDLPGLRLHALEAAAVVDDVRYFADERFRLELNTLFGNGKISVTGAPNGFPVATAEEIEIANGEVPGAGENGGSMPANWCVVAFDTPAPLTLAADNHNFLAAEMTIVAQSGTDFSVVTDSGVGAIRSEGGGMFQAGAAIPCPPGPTLDPSSTELRWLWFAFVIGKTPIVQNLGYDSLVPIFPPGTDNGTSALQTVASLPGIVAPGDPCLRNPNVNLVGGVTGDSIPLDFVFYPGYPNLMIWQVG